MTEVTGIDHIYIAVSDLERSEIFYDRMLSQALGFRKNKFALAGDPHVQYFNRHFGYVLRPARNSTEHDPYSAGMHHFCLRVDAAADVQTVAAELRALGIEASEARLYPEYAPDYWATFFTDPDGIRLEVTNYRLERRERHDNWNSGFASKQPVTFVAVEASDFEALVALRIEAMRESLERIGRFDPVRARERFRSSFSPEHTRHVVVNGQRVGFLVVKPQAGALLLDHLYVRPASQGLGIGSAVLARVIAEADALALPVRVGALRESDSNRFYARHGFELVEQGEFDNYYVRPIRLGL